MEINQQFKSIEEIDEFLLEKENKYKISLDKLLILEGTKTFNALMNSYKKNELKEKENLINLNNLEEKSINYNFSYDI